MSSRSPYLPYIALTAVCIIWGTTYLALRIGVLHFPPFLFSALRQTAAGILLAGCLLLFTKVSWPSKEHILRQVVGGFLLITIGNGLVAWGEMYVPSGLAAIICSLMPLMVILINLAVSRNEKPNLLIGIGVAIGLLGIVAIFSEHLGEFSSTNYVLGIVTIFTAVLSWASGSIWLKKHNADTNPFMNAALQMFFGGVFMFPISLVVDDLSVVTWSAEAGWSLFYLTIFGSIIAYACYAYALRTLTMTIVSMYAYINPLVAVLLGWLILDEKLTTRMGFAICVTVIGIYLVNRGYQQQKTWKPQPSK